MNESNKPHVADEKAGAAYPKTAVQFEQIARDTPEAMRALSRRISLSRANFMIAPRMLSTACLRVGRDPSARPGKALRRSTVRLSTFPNGTSIPGSILRRAWPGRAASLRSWNYKFDTLGAQAEEVRSLSNQVTADAVRPVQEQVKRSVGDKI